jgi:hypothetical protein
MDTLTFSNYIYLSPSSSLPESEIERSRERKEERKRESEIERDREMIEGERQRFAERLRKKVSKNLQPSLSFSQVTTPFYISL